jgi:AcrR family transcriptional regulator
VFVTHPAYIRDKARQLRVERDLTIDEIAERLAISRQTIFHWVRDLPMGRARRTPTVGQQTRNATNSARYKALRDAAYEEGSSEYDDLVLEPTFRDFVCLYIGEGLKRNRNRVALGNSNPNVLLLADHWMRRFAKRRVGYSVQFHADQDLEALRGFWGRLLRIDPAEIQLQRKSNSNQLNGRQWRSRWGILTVCANDTLFRAKLQAWMDRTFEEWLDLPARGA